MSTLISPSLPNSLVEINEFTYRMQINEVQIMSILTATTLPIWWKSSYNSGYLFLVTQRLGEKDSILSFFHFWVSPWRGRRETHMMISTTVASEAENPKFQIMKCINQLVWEIPVLDTKGIWVPTYNLSSRELLQKWSKIQWNVTR